MRKACKVIALVLGLIPLATWAENPVLPQPLPELEPQRQVPEPKLFNDPPLIIREYGFGMAGSLVAGTLCFYIGSGIESAFYNKDAHKGTLKFTGVRYDNFYGAFYGGATGLFLGSALTTYFVGQMDEEEGGFFATLLGTSLATGGALALASWMGVNDDISMVPFIPLLALPSIGAVAGFNISRIFHEKKRERVIKPASTFHIKPPTLAWSPIAGGKDRIVVQALNLSF